MDLNGINDYDTVTKQQWMRLREAAQSDALSPTRELEAVGLTRSCPVCDVPLPRSANERRVFCSSKCRARAARRRHLEAVVNRGPQVVHAAAPRLPLAFPVPAGVEGEDMGTLISALVTSLKANEVEIVYGSLHFFVRTTSGDPRLR